MAHVSARTSREVTARSLGRDATTDLQRRLRALADGLSESAWLWQPRPFATTVPPWAEREPELAMFCLSLDTPTLNALEEGAPLPADAPRVIATWRDRLAELTAVPDAPREARPSRDVGHQCDAGNTVSQGAQRDWRWLIPGRKLRQINSFVDVLAGALQTADGTAATHILDWCGGKGHLGRSLGHALGLPVTILERESSYADESRALAQRLDVDVTFEALDALSSDAVALVARMPATTLGVGLHACGALGERLIALGAAQRWPAIVHSPCCLHKLDGLKSASYRPLSLAGKDALDHAGLTLDHSALRLATSDETVARPALRKARSKENAWRLALDLLLQEAAGHDHYTALGTLPAALLRGDFETFARKAAALRGLNLPAGFSPELALQRGLARAHRARRFGLVRSFFRRAIEVFIAFDRAAFLHERGYRVSVTTFAERAATPRNLMVCAML